MKKIYTLIIGLLGCVSCGTDDSKAKQQPNTPQQGKDWYYTAQAKTLASAQQPVIKALKWGHTIICMPNGTLKETKDKTDWVLTPQGCQPWDYKEFGRASGDKKMGHLWPKRPKNKQGTGVLPYAIKGLLSNANGSGIVVIVSIGVHGDLGISQAAKDYLEELKTKGKIEAYHILNSKQVPARHNACVKAGKQVYTLLHTTC